MASDLFHELYTKAFRLDCPKIHTLNRLTQSMGPASTTQRARFIDDLLDAGREFDDELAEVALKNRMPVLPYEMRCPNCGDSNCPGAVPVAKMPKTIQEYLAGGGSLSDLIT